MRKIQIVRQEDPCDNSVRDEQYMRLKSLNFNNHALQSKDHVEVALAPVPAITIVKFVKSAKLEFLRIALLNLLWSEAITFPRVLSVLERVDAEQGYNFIKHAHCFHGVGILVEIFGGFPCSIQHAGPHLRRQRTNFWDHTLKDFSGGTKSAA